MLGSEVVTARFDSTDPNGVNTLVRDEFGLATLLTARYDFSMPDFERFTVKSVQHTDTIIDNADK
jgi:hypothetical protein